MGGFTFQPVLLPLETTMEQSIVTFGPISEGLGYHAVLDIRRESW